MIEAPSVHSVPPSAPPEVLCLGEALIDFVAAGRPAGLAQAASFTPAPGGAPLNVAVGLARLGRRSGFIGRVGDDAFGQALRELMRREGVAAGGVRLDPAARTTLAFVAEDQAGGREFLFYRHPGADMQLEADDLPRDQLRAARLLHFGTVSLSVEPARGATLAAVAAARAAGALISCDPNIRLGLWESQTQARDWVRHAIALAELVKLSEEEAALVTGTPDLSVAAARLRALGPRLVVITRGADGLLAQTAAVEVALPGYAVTAVDTTGAGDGAVAGLLAGLLALGTAARSLEGLAAGELRAALALANAVGALTTTRPGAIPALPAAIAVRDLLRGCGEEGAAGLLSAS